MKLILDVFTLIIALIIHYSPILLIGVVLYLIAKDYLSKNNISKPIQRIDPKFLQVLWAERNVNSTGTSGTGGGHHKKYPYKKTDILTPFERKFWEILKAVCDANNLLICPKVRMEDFIQVEEKQYAIKQRYRGKIKSRHIDFMICDKNMNILAGIELDDSTHNRKDAQEIDAFKNQVFADIQIPLYRVKLKAASNAAYIGEVTRIIQEITG